MNFKMRLFVQIFTILLFLKSTHGNGLAASTFFTHSTSFTTSSTTTTQHHDNVECSTSTSQNESSKSSEQSTSTTVATSTIYDNSSSSQTSTVNSVLTNATSTTTTIITTITDQSNSNEVISVPCSCTTVNSTTTERPTSIQMTSTSSESNSSTTTETTSFNCVTSTSISKITNATEPSITKKSSTMITNSTSTNPTTSTWKSSLSSVDTISTTLDAHATESNSIDHNTFSTISNMYNSVTLSGAYTFAKTLAFILMNEHNEIEDCDVYDLEKSPHSAFTKVSVLNLTLKVITFDQMRWILKECQELIELQSTAALDLIEMKNKTKLAISTRNLLSGLIPGTFWCGSGDMAHNYTDLGFFKYADSCCRQHDHCPIRLKPFQKGYGLINRHLYTKSHCKCDADLRQCLKRVNDFVARSVYKIFFQILSIPCIQPSNVTQFKFSYNYENNEDLDQEW